jgi:Transcriptional regulator, AbiEi antitoxin N-terminal domain
MTKQKETKLKWLEHNLPDGLIADASWLAEHGYSTSLRTQYVAARWLEQPARAVYRRPGGPLTWEQVVISLQMLLGQPYAVGGRTALELQGYTHYLRHETHEVHLYGPERPPGCKRSAKPYPRGAANRRLTILMSAPGHRVTTRH